MVLTPTETKHAYNRLYYRNKYGASPLAVRRSRKKVHVYYQGCVLPDDISKNEYYSHKWTDWPPGTVIIMDGVGRVK
jgi:hypothetical protein